MIDDLKVRENLDLPLQYRDVPSKERAAQVGDLLDRFNIVGKKDLYPSQLSGGQQQLVAVARAVITRPKLLLADEPTGALHSSQARMIMDLLHELNRSGMTIVQVTHNEEFAAKRSAPCACSTGGSKTPPSARDLPRPRRRRRMRKGDRMPNPARPNILIADDQRDVREALRLLLKAEGVDSAAADGPRARSTRCASSASTRR